MKINPCDGRVVLILDQPKTKTAGGLHLPDNLNDNQSLFGTVQSVGPGRLSSEGDRIAIDVKEGDRVVVRKHTGTELKLNENGKVITYHTFADTDILAKVSSDADDLPT